MRGACRPTGERSLNGRSPRPADTRRPIGGARHAEGGRGRPPARGQADTAARRAGGLTLVSTESVVRALLALRGGVRASRRGGGPALDDAVRGALPGSPGANRAALPAAPRQFTRRRGG